MIFWQWPSPGQVGVEAEWMAGTLRGLGKCGGGERHGRSQGLDHGVREVPVLHEVAAPRGGEALEAMNARVLTGHIDGNLVL